MILNAKTHKGMVREKRKTFAKQTIAIKKRLDSTSRLLKDMSFPVTSETQSCNRHKPQGSLACCLDRTQPGTIFSSRGFRCDGVRGASGRGPTVWGRFWGGIAGLRGPRHVRAVVWVCCVVLGFVPSGCVLLGLPGVSVADSPAGGARGVCSWGMFVGGAGVALCVTLRGRTYSKKQRSACYIV